MTHTNIASVKLMKDQLDVLFKLLRRIKVVSQAHSKI